MSIFKIIDDVASVGASTKKQIILEKHKENDTLKNCFRLAYHKGIMFGIKKWPSVKFKNTPTKSLDEALDFIENVLAKRVITGNDAIKSLGDLISEMNENNGDVEVLRRVISRDIDCGAGRTIANKVWKNLIPVQPQMLASSYSEKNISNIRYPAYAQLKADGARAMAEIRGSSVDDIVILSRAGNEYYGLDNIKNELIKLFGHLLEKYPCGIMVDGELVYHEPAGLSFLDDDKESVAVERTKSNGIANKSLKNTITTAESANMIFQTWDLVPIDIMYGTAEENTLTYEERYKCLSECLKHAKKIECIETQIVNDLKEARAVYQKYVDQGLEGSILKNIDSVWENKRSKNIVKFKEIYPADLVVVGYYPHRKDPNKLGGVCVESACGKIKLNVGSGFTDTTHEKIPGERGQEDEWIYIPFEKRDDRDREKLWANKEDLIGRICELDCNGWLKSKNNKIKTVSLFLCVFKKWRIDKDEANTFEDIFGDDFYNATGIK